MLLQQGFQRAHGEDLALIENGDAVTESFRFLHVVCGVDDGPTLAAERLDLVKDQVPRLRIDTHRGLVQEQDGRIVHQCAGEVESTHHAAGVLGNVILAAIRQSHEVKDSGHAITQSASRHAVQSGEEQRVFLAGQFLVQRQGLGCVADLLANVGMQRISTGTYGHTATVGFEPTHQRVNGGGLARPVGTEETEYLTGGDVERDVIDGDQLAELLAETGDGDHVFIRTARPEPGCVAFRPKVPPA